MQREEDLLLKHDLELIDKLGEGGFGKVYKALDMESGECVAVKVK